MKRKFSILFILFVLFLLYTGNVHAQAPLWNWASQGGASDYDYARAITVDAAGNTYVTGYFKNAANFGTHQLIGTGGYDIFVAKLDASGTWEWAKQGLIGRFQGYYTTQKGTNKYWDVVISPICDNDGKVIELLTISRDITKSKLADDQLEKELKENKLLLDEIHHRVKNNLQVISSLLQLQQAEMNTDKDIAKGFAASKDSIQAMAKAYELLLQSKYMTDVRLGEYIESLAEQLKTNYDIHNKVTISYSMDEVTIGIVILDRLGLVLNEVITNAIQFAFTGRDSGNIHIELKDAGEYFKIKISDDGVGIPKEVKIHDPTTLGLSIIDMITQQLLGTVKLVRKNGTSFTLVFPKKTDENL